MSRTVDEKVKYNREKRTPFSYGYVWGVKAYRAYQTHKAEEKRILAEMDDYGKCARNSKGKSGECAKGYMCAMRDCANERKARQNKK